MMWMMLCLDMFDVPPLSFGEGKVEVSAKLFICIFTPDSVNQKDYLK